MHQRFRSFRHQNLLHKPTYLPINSIHTSFSVVSQSILIGARTPKSGVGKSTAVKNEKKNPTHFDDAKF